MTSIFIDSIQQFLTQTLEAVQANDMSKLPCSSWGGGGGEAKVSEQDLQQQQQRSKLVQDVIESGFCFAKSETGQKLARGWADWLDERMRNGG